MKRRIMMLLLLMEGLTGLHAQEVQWPTIESKYKGTTTLTAEVTQVRHMAALSQDKEEKGKFYFSRPDQFCILMGEGEQLLAIDHRFTMVSGGKRRTIASTSHAFNPYEALVETFLQLLSPDGERRVNNSTFTIERQHGQLLLHFVPMTNGKGKKRLRQLSCTLEVDEAAGEVRRFVIHESGENYTAYQFSNYVANQPVDKALFDVTQESLP